MNGYDLQVIDAIQRYHMKHGAYPEQVEATHEFMKMLSQTTFSFQEVEVDDAAVIHRIVSPHSKIVTVPVIPLEG